MSDCSESMRFVWLEMSVVSTRSRALWPPISELLRSIFFWIWPGDWSADDPTGRTDQSAKGRTTAKEAARARRNRMSGASVSDPP